MAEGHRERLRERVEQYGIASLQDHEVLEYLLYPFIPRRDTNPIGHALITCFGSLAAVLEADVEALEDVDGMTHNAALFLSTFLGVSEKYRQSKLVKNKVLDGHGVAKQYMQAFLYHRPEEQSYMLCLDSKMQLSKTVKLSDGIVNRTEISVRKLVKSALLNNAVYVILGHNHPSGNLSPSDNDIAFTKSAFIMMDQIGVILLDHIIVCGDESYSFKAEGLMIPIIKAYKNITTLSEKEMKW